MIIITVALVYFTTGTITYVRAYSIVRPSPSERAHFFSRDHHSRSITLTRLRVFKKPRVHVHRDGDDVTSTNTFSSLLFCFRRTEGRYLACTYRAKYIEVSVGINHNVDELLVGILTQIRLKRASGDEGHDHWYKNRNFIKASLKARQMLTWVFGKEDTKMKNCENLHVL